MSPREKLQRAYELAFHPVVLNAVWNDYEKGRVVDAGLLCEIVDLALTLHQRLPEAPAASARALRRLARYQATSRLYRLPSALRRLRESLGGPAVLPEEVPAWMVRDMGLPVFSRAEQHYAASLNSGY